MIFTAERVARHHDVECQSSSVQLQAVDFESSECRRIKMSVEVVHYLATAAFILG